MKTIQELHADKYCADCKKVVETYWQLWSCDKNPDGEIPAAGPHGNEIDGMTTCEDDYCNPTDGEVDKREITPEYVRTHEVHERCCECDQHIESM